MITSHGPQNITSGVSKDFKDISYTLDDENEEEGSEEEMKDTAWNNVILEKWTWGAAAA